MLRTYLPRTIHHLFIIGILVSYLAHSYYFFIFLIFLYVFVFYLFRKHQKFSAKNPTGGNEGLVFSPCNGNVEAIRTGVNHALFGENLLEVKLEIPLFEEMGIYLPQSVDVQEFVIKKAKKFFQMSLLQDLSQISQKKEILEGVLLTLKNTSGEKIGLQILNSFFSFWPEVYVMPGDKGRRNANIGYAPFGGHIFLYLPAQYNAQVRVGDRVNAFESILATTIK